MAGTYSYTFDTVLASHLREVKQKTPREQSYTRNAALLAMQRTNKLPVDRGGYIHVNVSAIESAKGGPYNGASPVSTAGSEDVHTAQYRRALYAEPIKILHSEELDAGGERALFSLATHKMKQARRRLENRIATDLWSTSAVTDGITGIPQLITTTPTTGTMGGLDRSTHSWWRNQTVTGFGSFGSNLNKLDQISLDVTADGGEMWDWMVTDDTTFLRFQNQGRAYLQINVGAPQGNGAKRIAEFGFPVVEWQGKPVIFDRNAVAGRIFVMHNEAIKLATITGEEFAMTDFAPLHPSGVQGRIAFLRWAGQVVVIEPRLLGVADGITA